MTDDAVVRETPPPAFAEQAAQLGNAGKTPLYAAIDGRLFGMWRRFFRTSPGDNPGDCE